jgi:transcription initiation factor TFIIH subunit 1
LPKEHTPVYKTDGIVFSARLFGKHQGTVPPTPNGVPPKSTGSTGPEQVSSAEMERRMKLLREDR